VILALDYGRKRFGVALSNDDNRFAFAQNPIIFKNINDLLNKLEIVLNKNKINLIVLGIPLGEGEKDTQMSIEIKEFAQEILSKFNIEIILWNEVMTSNIASMYTKKDKSGKIDSESARIILQEYLDFKNKQ
jgi:putative holliday junction resolvase